MGKTALVVTVGSKHESLGATKLAAWLRRLGWQVDEATSIGMFDAGKDLYAFSAVFSWKLPSLVEMVRMAKRWGEVWIGGPAVKAARLAWRKSPLSVRLGRAFTDCLPAFLQHCRILEESETARVSLSRPVSIESMNKELETQ